MSAGAMILCGGAAGQRYALPNAKLMIHQGSAGFSGTPADIQIQAREVLETMQRMAEVIALHSGRAIDEVLGDIDRDRFMTAAEGVEYGLIDRVMAPTKASQRAA
jgi:ATP-dependent Clp protease, protease subunit